MPGAPMADADAREADGDAAVAHAVIGRMQASGARDRVKEWLFDALEAAGWTAAIAERAAAVRGPAAGEPAAVADIVKAVEGAAFETVPAEVRERLVAEVLAEAKEAAEAPAGGK